MKSLYRLLPLLSHQHFTSGQLLAGELQVTRPTVSNWVAELVAQGVDVYSVKGRGYRLAEPISLLDRDRVLALLSKEVTRRLSVLDIRTDVDSTNAWVLAQPPAPGRWSVCTADFQHQGRGRRGRAWQSPPASSVMVSAAVRESLTGDALYAASLVVGVAVVRAIRQVAKVSVALKWPNDIYCDGRKLGGVLCELQGNPLDQPVLVVGIGLNVNASPPGLDRDIGCLRELAGEFIDRNDLLAALLNELQCVLADLGQAGGLATLLQEWASYDCLLNRSVTLVQGEQQQIVVARGIDAQGQLIIDDERGQRRTVNGGEVSVLW
ncbi:biotin--[acetyl-CoA-carboxylase] ligase [Saccharospirillum impatiens]|uniref:biotin--[acetyl-CoA-carboxylase] ligase n=1 Tax=Saccharospirillum impatiens TaxID=169438 RepID=UPI00040733DB|nr:biotin--[acetyl-CoA-carboxylase] ligase [Saccharospirillum impatiens]